MQFKLSLRKEFLISVSVLTLLVAATPAGGSGLAQEFPSGPPEPVVAAESPSLVSHIRRWVGVSLDYRYFSSGLEEDASDELAGETGLGRRDLGLTKDFLSVGLETPVFDLKRGWNVNALTSSVAGVQSSSVLEVDLFGLQRIPYFSFAEMEREAARNRRLRKELKCDSRSRNKDCPPAESTAGRSFLSILLSSAVYKHMELRGELFDFDSTELYTIILFGYKLEEEKFWNVRGGNPDLKIKSHRAGLFFSEGMVNMVNWANYMLRLATPEEKRKAAQSGQSPALFSFTLASTGSFLLFVQFVPGFDLYYTSQEFTTSGETIDVSGYGASFVPSVWLYSFFTSDYLDFQLTGMAQYHTGREWLKPGGASSDGGRQEDLPKYTNSSSGTVFSVQLSSKF